MQYNNAKENWLKNQQQKPELKTNHWGHHDRNLSKFGHHPIQ